MQSNHSAAHGPGYGIYILIWIGLVVLTGMTVAVAGISLEQLTITVALMIAGVKSFLVIMYFMHLKYEPILFKVMVGVCLITFVIFIVLTFSDILFR